MRKPSIPESVRVSSPGESGSQEAVINLMQPESAENAPGSTASEDPKPLLDDSCEPR
jgi:hypothetical protein